MSFHDVQFPPEISYGATGGPQFSTIIAKATRSKREWRDIGDEEGTIRWNVAPGCTDEAKLHALIAFIRNRYGNAHSFRFKDWTDYQMVRMEIAQGDATTTQFQTVKTYNDGVFSVTRDITKPIAATYQLWVDSVLQTPTTHYTLDALTGIVTFVSAPAALASIEAECEFDIPVRFEKDGLKTNMADFDHHRSQVTVREVFNE